MGSIKNLRPVAAALIAGLASTLVGAPPAPLPGGSCSCCDGGLCPLDTAGCDHRQTGARSLLTSCCIGAAEPLGTVAGTALSELEAAILSLSSAPANLVFVAWRSPPALRLPAAPVQRPEPPPPRSLSTRNA